MTPFRNWIIARPFQSFALAALFGSLSTAAGLREDWLPWLLALFCAGLVLLVVSMWRFTGPVLVALAVLFHCRGAVAQVFPERNAIEPAGVGVAVGVTVICIGAYCVYKFSKFCAKKFPPKDAGSNSLSVAFGQGDEYGAAYNYGALGSCWEGQDNSLAPMSASGGTLWQLDIMLDSPYATRQTMTATTGDDLRFQTFTEFQAEMATHGLHVSGTADGSQSFSWNRQTIDPTMSPISFDPVTKSVRNTLAGEGEMRRITVTRSSDLREWNHFLTTEVGVGAGVRVVDATECGQMFYRVEVSQ